MTSPYLKRLNGESLLSCPWRHANFLTFTLSNSISSMEWMHSWKVLMPRSELSFPSHLLSEEWIPDAFSESDWGEKPRSPHSCTRIRYIFSAFSLSVSLLNILLQHTEMLFSIPGACLNLRPWNIAERERENENIVSLLYSHLSPQPSRRFS